MGKIRPPEDVALFVATLYSKVEYFEKAVDILKEEYGDILFKSHPYRWDYSTYYNKELGYPVIRQFIFFEKLINPQFLPDIKIRTNEIEDILSIEGKRQINLDPGYITLSKVVLASTKNYAHRLYLGKGVYGEVTLIFREKTYQPHIFTYKDYQDKTCLDMFNNIREVIKDRLKEKR
jgi:hypothetical protein